MMRSTLMVAAFLLASTVVRGQARLELLGGGVVNIGDAGFASLPEVPTCCPQFSGGSGFGGFAAVGGSVGVTSVFGVGLRLGLRDVGHTLTTEESASVISGGELVEGRFEHRLQLRQQRIVIEPTLRWEPSQRLQVRLGAGIGMAGAATVDASEELLAPAQGVFFDTETRRRGQATAALAGRRATTIDLVLGVGLRLPLGSTGQWAIVPDVSYTIGLTPITDAVPWSVHGITLGLGLQWALPRAELPVPELASEPAPQPVAALPPRRTADAPVTTSGTVPRPAADAGASVVPPSPAPAVPATASADERPILTETARVMHPMLPYVFFDWESDVLPARYHRLDADEATDFRASALSGVGATGLHQHVLNVVGERLLGDRRATIVLTGCLASDEDDPALAVRRARAVRSYLQNVFGIDTARMTVRSRRLPAQATASSDANRRWSDDENRRVEITASVPSIVDPVVTSEPAARRGAQYALVLFDFDRATLTTAHRRILDTIRAAIPAEASVEIRGSSDAMGDAERNRRLAAERAREVAKALGLPAGTVHDVDDRRPRSQALPEERMLLRTVVIDVPEK